jgi:predicted regulator of Ras-like GTPase activity (Roadblock/LC7/MglB family)
MVAKVEQLEKVVKDLRALPHVLGAVIVSRGGIVIASSAADDAHAETFAAMGATMNGAASAALSEFRKNGPERMLVEGQDCVMAAVDAGPKAILIVLRDGKDGGAELLSKADAAGKTVRETLS